MTRLIAGYPGRYGVGLPPHRALCYKRYMRKWMSDRMKRRKKGDGASKEKATKAPEPLQPKYFESELGEKPAERAIEPATPAHEPMAQEHAAPQHSGRERSVAERPTAQRSTAEHAPPRKETQADFQLGSRRPPELPLAEAVQGEGRNRPARRRRKRGGRGGERRGPVGAPAVGRAASAVAPPEIATEIDATETAAGVSDAVSYEVPLTPESAGGEAPVTPVAAVAVPPASTSQLSTAQVAPAGAGVAAPVVAARPRHDAVFFAQPR